jgi:hypothetical protein
VTTQNAPNPVALLLILKSFTTFLHLSGAAAPSAAGN